MVRSQELLDLSQLRTLEMVPKKEETINGGE